MDVHHTVSVTGEVKSQVTAYLQGKAKKSLQSFTNAFGKITDDQINNPGSAGSGHSHARFMSDLSASAAINGAIDYAKAKDYPILMVGSKFKAD